MEENRRYGTYDRVVVTKDGGEDRRLGVWRAVGVIGRGSFGWSHSGGAAMVVWCSVVCVSVLRCCSRGCVAAYGPIEEVEPSVVFVGIFE